MVLPHRIPIVTTLILVLVQTPLEAKNSRTDPLCPLGFKLAFTKSDRRPICYRLKGREKLNDMYRDCVGNLYSIELYRELNIKDDGIPLWTEYRAAYPNGPFVDWSNGTLLDKARYPITSTGTEDCLVFNSITYVSLQCDREYYRYCFVEPYHDKDDMPKTGCEDLPDSRRIGSPKPTCLLAKKVSGGGSPRANWSQSLVMCNDLGATLLNRGWIYSNIPWLHKSDVHVYPEYPLGVIYYPSNILTDVNGKSIPLNEHFSKSTFPNETAYGLVRNGSWELTSDSYLFYDVICERPVSVKTIDLTVIIENDNIFLKTNDTIKKNKISCFTDSKTFYPTPVDISQKEQKTFVLKPVSNGYYWCLVTDPVYYAPSESNRALFVRVEEELRSLYAVKMTLLEQYDFDNIETMDYWKTQIKQYIYYYTKYTESGRKLGENLDDDEMEKAKEEILKEFMRGNKGIDEKDIGNAVTEVKLKQVYRNRERILAHVMLMPPMQPVPEGTWYNIRVESMQPVDYCTREDHRFRDTATFDCVEYKCTGDFNEGYKDVRGSQVTPCIITSTEPSIRLDTEFTVMTTSVGTMLPVTPTKDLTNRQNASGSSEESTERKPTPPQDVVTTESNTEPPPPPPTPIDPTEVVTVNTPTRPPLPTTTDAPTTTDQPTTTDPPTTEPPRPQPEEQLEQVITDLETLLNDSEEVLVDNIKDTFDLVDQLFQENVELEIPGTLLRLLDDVGGRIVLNGTNNATTVGSNVALLVADAAPGRPVRGLRLAATDSNEFSEDAFQFITTEADASQLQAAKSDVVVMLPEAVGNSTRRISFVVFRNDRAFQTMHYAVNSRILSVNVENLTHFDTDQYINIHFTPTGEPTRNESRACAYWEFDSESGDGGSWSRDGCTFLPATSAGQLATCRCDHLTHFAEILIPRPVFSQRNEDALELLSVVGCCLSIVGLAMVGLTALLFRSWRRDFSNKIWLQLCVAIFLLVLCFLIVALVKFDEYNVGCLLTGLALHYATLASFCWMLVAAVLSYRRLVLVFNRDTSHKLLKAAAFAWGAPFAVVGVLLSVDPLSYAGRFEEKTPAGAFCYPSGLSLWLTVFAPIIIMLIANWTLFVLIVRSVFASRRVQRHGDSHNDALRCASVSCLLVFLFGLPWVFGVFSFNVVAAYFFTLTATYQGFVLFIFFVVGNKKTRDLWLNKLKIKQTRKVPVTSSTYTNRSTGTSGRPVGPASAGGNVTKPRSLATPDDSRFS